MSVQTKISWSALVCSACLLLCVAVAGHASEEAESKIKLQRLKQRIFEQLAVKRCGASADSCMTTQAIELLVDGDTVYQYSAGKGISPLTEVAAEGEIRRFASCDAIPKGLLFTSFAARWNKTTSIHDNSNILGGNGKLLVATDKVKLTVPVVLATEEYLSYYKAHAIHAGDKFRFQTQRKFPIFTLHIGDRYLTEYVMKKGVGMYLEYHNEAHFHEPMDESAGGVYLLAREVEAGDPGSGEMIYHVTAFRVPFGSAVYSQPGAIHDDAATKGNWRVGYINAEIFSTVTIFNARNQVIELTFDS